MGVAAETTFLRGALDQLGIEPQLEKRYEYKTVVDGFAAITLAGRTCELTALCTRQ